MTPEIIIIIPIILCSHEWQVKWAQERYYRRKSVGVTSALVCISNFPTIRLRCICHRLPDTLCKTSHWVSRMRHNGWIRYNIDNERIGTFFCNCARIFHTCRRVNKTACKSFTKEQHRLRHLTITAVSGRKILDVHLDK